MLVLVVQREVKISFRGFWRRFKCAYWLLSLFVENETSLVLLPNAKKRPLPYPHCHMTVGAGEWPLFAFTLLMYDVIYTMLDFHFSRRSKGQSHKTLKSWCDLCCARLPLLPQKKRSATHLYQSFSHQHILKETSLLVLVAQKKAKISFCGVWRFKCEYWLLNLFVERLV